MRLAAIYALLDGTDKIALAHLKAGLEVWRYCEDSAAYVFGTALGRSAGGSDTGLARCGRRRG